MDRHELSHDDRAEPPGSLRERQGTTVLSDRSEGAGTAIRIGISKQQKPALRDFCAVSARLGNQTGAGEVLHTQFLVY